MNEEQTFSVPGGVVSLHVVAIGAAGGEVGGVSGGAGAEVVGNVTVTPGQTLYVEVGNNGKTDGSGGFNGGAEGGTGAGGGGGASDVRTSERPGGAVGRASSHPRRIDRGKPVFSETPQAGARGNVLVVGRVVGGER
jgi:hypothetical protein